jgi:hypothetical protein
VSQITYTTTTTGLRIGCLHQSKPEHDADALKVQNAVTGRTEPADRDGILIVLGCAVAGVIGTLIYMGKTAFLWLLATTFF